MANRPLQSHLAGRSKKITKQLQTPAFRTGLKDGLKAPFVWLAGKTRKTIPKVIDKTREMSSDPTLTKKALETTQSIQQKWRNRTIQATAAAKLVAVKTIAVKVSLVALPVSIVTWLGYGAYRGIRNKRSNSQFLTVQKKHLGRLIGWAATTDALLEQQLNRHQRVALNEQGEFVFDSKKEKNPIKTTEILKWLNWYRATPKEEINRELERLKHEIVSSAP